MTTCASRSAFLMLRDQLAERHRQELEALERVRRALEGEPNNATHFTLIRGVLRSRVDALTVAEIARATGLPPTAVRMVVYTRKDVFEKATDSRPIRWRVREHVSD